MTEYFEPMPEDNTTVDNSIEIEATFLDIAYGYGYDWRYYVKCRTDDILDEEYKLSGSHNKDEELEILVGGTLKYLFKRFPFDDGRDDDVIYEFTELIDSFDYENSWKHSVLMTKLFVAFANEGRIETVEEVLEANHGLLDEDDKYIVEAAVARYFASEDYPDLALDYLSRVYHRCGGVNEKSSLFIEEILDILCNNANSYSLKNPDDEI